MKFLHFTILLSFTPFAQPFCSKCANKCDAGPNFHHFILERRELSPDNYAQTGVTINGKFIGPTIRIPSYQFLVIKVTNLLTEGVSMHWHGLYQTETIASDGSEMITQDNIAPNSSYTYCMWISQAGGTYFYHAHNGLWIIWVHGALIIEDYAQLWNSSPAIRYRYHEDKIMILSQLYHISVEDFTRILLVTGGARPISPSLTINGQSYGVWSDSTNSCSVNSSAGYAVVNVQKGLVYRLRLINVCNELMLRFSISNHNMTVIEMDGVYTEPLQVEYVVIAPAQRYSVLVTMGQAVDNYWIQTTAIPGPGPLNGAAILHYYGAVDPTPLTKILKNGTSPAVPIDEWVTEQLRPNLALGQWIPSLPKKIDRTILIDFQLQIFPPVLRFTINGHIFKDPVSPYLKQIRSGVNVTDEPQVYEIITGQGIQFIIQNRAGGATSNCDPHPWHFHGRHFYVVAHGPDEYNEERDAPIIEKAVQDSKGKVQFRDVFVQFPYQSIKNTTGGTPCGWYAVRFLANNPGIWAMHCHITPHMVLGKMFVLWEHTLENPRLYGE